MPVERRGAGGGEMETTAEYVRGGSECRVSVSKCMSKSKCSIYLYGAMYTLSIYFLIIKYNYQNQYNSHLLDISNTSIFVCNIHITYK